MRALEYHAAGRMRLTHVPSPRAPAGGLVLDVVAAGICGTDLKIARGEHRLYPPGTVRVPGHEVVGRIRETATGGVQEGDLVAVAPNIGCGRCRPCTSGRPNLCTSYECIGLTMDGGFADSVVVPPAAVAQHNVLPVPAGLDPLVAVLTEPLAAVLRGVQALSLARQDALVVLGAGPIGLLTVLLAKQWGVRRVVVSQTSALRRELALRCGADVVVDPRAEDLRDRVLSETDGFGADCVVVATPAPDAFSQSLDVAAVGGRVNFFAGLPTGRGQVTIDANLIHYRELTVTGSTANTARDCAQALEILAQHPGAYRPLVTHRFGLAEHETAFAVAARGEAIKVVVEP